MKEIALRRGRDASLRRRHPWVYSGALQDATPSDVEPGETVRIVDAFGAPLALAAWSPRSRIRARVWSFDPETSIDETFLRQRLLQAIGRRGTKAHEPGAACRLIFSESDELPGLIVDRYDDVLVCQLLSAGMEVHREVIADQLMDLTGASCLYERSDASIREREGLSPRSGLLRGGLPADRPVIQEGDARYRVDVLQGHKTGFYLDQVANRALAGELAAGRRVLNCFSYTGAFSVATLLGGARHVTSVEASASALEQADEHVRDNGLPVACHESLCANVFQQMRAFREQGRRFDMIILDPPRFADSRTQLKKASRAYKDIALQAGHLLEPGGLLMTFSCSGAIDMPLFQKITADALLDAGRLGQVQRWLYQHSDHPVALPFPESLYLKGLVCRVD